MSSIGTPELERSETKLCRNSRGVHSEAFKPAAAATVRNDPSLADAAARPQAGSA
jgi:hypothetical protein